MLVTYPRRTGPDVQAVQQALLDLGYELPVDGADGKFGPETGKAVIRFQDDLGIDHPGDIDNPWDAAIGKDTMGELDKEWAVPFADRDEWLSWQTRPFSEWNFTREDELSRRRTGAGFTFTPESAWLPAPFRDALVTGLAALLDPFGSPDGSLTPSATWGVSLLDLYHCHVVANEVPSDGSGPWVTAKAHQSNLANTLQNLKNEASQAWDYGTAAWTNRYRELLLAPGTPGTVSVRDQAASILNEIHAESVANQRTVSLVWHTFEFGVWRPVNVADDDPRRRWWNVVSPQPSGVSHTPFYMFVSHDAQGNPVFWTVPLIDLAFVIDKYRAVTVIPETQEEAAAVAGIPISQLIAIQH